MPSTNKPLIVLLSAMLLSGCSSILPAHPVVNNQCPAPEFPTCKTVCEAGRTDVDNSVYKDLVRFVNVMLKLQALEDPNDQQPFSECTCSSNTTRVKPHGTAKPNTNTNTNTNTNANANVSKD